MPTFNVGCCHEGLAVGTVVPTYVAEFPEWMLDLEDDMKLPSYKAITDLIKKGATIEAQEKIMELREAAVELQEDNINLKNTVLELQEKIRKLEAFEGEPCPKCHRPAWVIESSKPDSTFGDLGGVRRQYRCTECDFSESVLVTEMS